MLCYLCCYAMCAYHWNTQLVSISHHHLRQPQKAVWASNLHHQASRLLQFLNAHAWPNHGKDVSVTFHQHWHTRPTPVAAWVASPHLTATTAFKLNVGWSLGPTQIPLRSWSFPRHLLIFLKIRRCSYRYKCQYMFKKDHKIWCLRFLFVDVDPFRRSWLEPSETQPPYGQGTPAGSAYSFARPQPGTAARCGFQTATLPEPRSSFEGTVASKSENPP